MSYDVIQLSRDALAMAISKLRAGDQMDNVEDEVWYWLVTVHGYEHKAADKYASDVIIEAVRQISMEQVAP